MKTMLDFRMCCCCSMHMTSNEKVREKLNQHIINNIYRQQHEKISIPNSIDLRAAA